MFVNNYPLHMLIRIYIKISLTLNHNPPYLEIRFIVLCFLLELMRWSSPCHSIWIDSVSYQRLHSVNALQNLVISPQPSPHQLIRFLTKVKYSYLK